MAPLTPLTASAHAHGQYSVSCLVYDRHVRPQVIGRDDVIRRVVQVRDSVVAGGRVVGSKRALSWACYSCSVCDMQVLSRRTKNNPVLIGEPGVGKTAIAEGLARY